MGANNMHHYGYTVAQEGRKVNPHYYPLIYRPDFPSLPTPSQYHLPPIASITAIFVLIIANPPSVNKTSSAVQLRHIPTGIVVKSQATRSREQNRKIARRILAEKLEQLEKGSESRAAVLQREESRRRRSKEKKARRK